jgi:hypothetical protein
LALRFHWPHGDMMAMRWSQLMFFYDELVALATRPPPPPA